MAAARIVPTGVPNGASSLTGGNLQRHRTQIIRQMAVRLNEAAHLSGRYPRHSIKRTKMNTKAVITATLNLCLRGKVYNVGNEND